MPRPPLDGARPEQGRHPLPPRRHAGRGAGAVRALAGLAITALAATLPARGAVAGPVPRVLVVGPLDSYGTLVAGVSEGLQAGGFSDASQIRVDVRARAPDEARAIVAAAVQEGVDAIVAVLGQATHAAHQLAPSTSRSRPT